MVAAELLTVEEELFADTIKSDQYLDQGKSGYLGSRRNFYTDRWNDVLHVAESIRTETGQTKMEFSDMPEDDLESFLRGLHPATLASGRGLVLRYVFTSYRSRLDVGGGSGELAIAVTEALPQIQATILGGVVKSGGGMLH